MEGVDRVGRVVDAIEERLIIAVGVEGVDFGGVEIAAAVGGVSGEEVAEVLVADGERGIGAGGSEAAVGGTNAAFGMEGAESGLGGGAGDERGFVSVLGGNDAFYDLHGLDGVDGNLIGEGFALLIADGLAVDGVGGVGMFAERVEHAIGVGGDAGTGEGDGVADAVSAADERKLVDEIAADVGLVSGVGLKLAVGGG